MITNVPAFAQTTITNPATIAAACVLGAANAPTNTILAVTAGSDGALLTALAVIPRSTVAAGTAYAFSSLDGGVNQFLIGAIAYPAQTITTTSGITPIQFAFSESTSRRMKAGEQIYIGMTSVATSGAVADPQWSNF